MSDNKVKEIKTHEVKHDIKYLDRYVEAAKSMKKAAIRAKNQAGNVIYDGSNSAEEYAQDKMKNDTLDTALKAEHKMNNVVKRLGKQSRIRQEQYGVRQHKAKTRDTRKKQQTMKTGDIANRMVKMSHNTTGKTTHSAVPSKEKHIKTAVNSTQHISNRLFVDSKTAVGLGNKIARASHKSASAIKKALVSSVRIAVNSVKSLVAMLTAGSSIAGVVILIICMVGLLVGSVFGIFFSGEDTGSGKTMQAVVQEINSDYQNEIDSAKSTYSYDIIEMSGSTAAWREVLSVYAVKTNNDPVNPQEVASLDDKKIQILKDIFWSMNDISSRTETKTVEVIKEADDGKGNIVENRIREKRTILYITVNHKTAYDMADEYDFKQDERRQLAELLNEKNSSLWAAVLYGIRSGDGKIVEIALSQIGNVGGQPYWSWYGFNSRVEWCACFVSWCANECGYIEGGVIPKFAGCGNGVQWFKTRDQWLSGNEEPVPGMIVFFDWDRKGNSGPQDGKPDHTGIVEKVEDGIIFTIEGNSGNRCREKQYAVGYYEILGFGCPSY